MWILPKQLHTSAYVPDMAALNLDLNESSQICARSLFVRSKASLARTWSQKWKRDSWTALLSGRILRPFHGPNFVTAWTSLLGATPASPSAQPANDSAQKTLGTCGPILQTAFDFSDLGAASLKTSKDISAWGCPTSSKTWQEWVIERRGAYSARLNAVRRTSGSGCSSWPTAATRDYKGQSGFGRQERKGHPSDTLPNAMAQWPSPVASEVRQGFQDRSRGMKGSQESLTTVVIKHGPPVPASSSTDGSRQGLWQTATVSTGAHKQKDGSMTDKLDQQVKSWATPDASDRRSDNCRQVGLSNQIKQWPTPASSTGNGGPHGLDGGQGARSMIPQEMRNSGKLNPRWVETLMGLPVGWVMPSCVSPVTIAQTSCDSSATESCLQQQSELFDF
jgi:hypothetical protein